MTLTEKAIDAMHCAGVAMERHEKFLAEKQAADRRIAERIPQTAEALLRSGLIEGHEADELKRTLANPAATLSLLTKVAQHYHGVISEPESVTSPIGTPVKSASANPTEYPGRNADGLTAADREYFRMVLGHVPE